MENNTHESFGKLTLTKSWKTDLLLGTFCNKNFEHVFSLSDQTVNKIKIGENLTDETFEFFISEFLSDSSSMKNKTNENSNFLIVTEKYLYKHFRRGVKYSEEELGYIKNLNILDKQAVFIPIKIATGIWNLAIIENISSLIKPEILKNNNMLYRKGNTAIQRPKFSFYIFEKLQVENKEMCKRLLELVENLFSFYMRLKYNVENFDVKGFAINAFDFEFIKLKSFNKSDDTGLVIAKMLMDCVAEETNMVNFLNSTDFNNYATEMVSLNNREILKNKISECFAKAGWDFPRNTVSFKYKAETETTIINSSMNLKTAHKDPVVDSEYEKETILTFNPSDSNVPVKTKEEKILTEENEAKEDNNRNCDTTPASVFKENQSEISKDSSLLEAENTSESFYGKTNKITEMPIDFSKRKSQYSSQKDQVHITPLNEQGEENILKARNTVSTKEAQKLYDNRMKIKNRQSFYKVKPRLSNAVGSAFKFFMTGNKNLDDPSKIDEESEEKFASRTLPVYKSITQEKEDSNKPLESSDKKEGQTIAPESGDNTDEIHNDGKDIFNSQQCLLTQEDFAHKDTSRRPSKPSLSSKHKQIEINNYTSTGSEDDYSKLAPQSKVNRYNKSKTIVGGASNKKTEQNSNKTKNKNKKLDQICLDAEQMQQKRENGDEEEDLLCNCDAKCLIY